MTLTSTPRQKMFRFGNNIYPGVPELAGVLQSPSVRGALTSILGKDYVMHAHRALHLYKGMGSEQGFHQDTPEGHGPVRFHRPRWAMILYYPNGATDGMGPTGVLPGGQYFQADPKEQPTVGETLGGSSRRLESFRRALLYVVWVITNEI